MDKITLVLTDEEATELWRLLWLAPMTRTGKQQLYDNIRDRLNREILVKQNEAYKAHINSIPECHQSAQEAPGRQKETIDDR